MKNFEDLDPEVQAIARQSQELRQKNVAISGALEQVGVTFDVGPARVEHLMTKLVDAGILSDEQSWAIHLDWEESLHKQLTDAMGKVRDQMMAQEAAARRQASVGKLLKPVKPGKLIVPGQ